ncbi:MAG: hypothetical protein JWM11_3896 [Planctomycetaceae bacterium]|nr:hypothetical protein [Planctomycetaceae bacterium]
MDDTACLQFFTQPTQAYHRQYEALRAIFIDHRSQKEVAEQFGYRYLALRQLVREFRQYCSDMGSDESPFFGFLDQSRLSIGSDSKPNRKLPIDGN